MGRLRVNDPNTRTLSSSPPRIHRSGENVFILLAQREISPRTKCMPRMHWGGAPKQPPEFTSGLQREPVRDARRGLSSWVEAESLLHLSAKYCSLVPPPRSTIAAAFSPDGKTLASTHGDHTVKIIDCQSGSCLKVLYGHCRTPWVVRFHPQYPEILASGSLDHEVRLWDADTSECIESHNFYRPIASIAFHAEGELIAVASGHKLYLWHYKKGEISSPSMVLKTRRSLRAVHFHPHAAPFLLTAEVNDLDLSDSSITLATAPACVDCPLPSVYIANIHHTNAPNVVGDPPLRSLPLSCPSSYGRDDFRVDLQVSSRPVALNNSTVQSSALLLFQQDGAATEQCDDAEFPMDLSPSIPSDIHAAMQASDVHSSIHETTGIIETSELQLEGYRQSNFSNQFSLSRTNCSPPLLNQSRIARSLFVHPYSYSFQYGQQQYTSSADTTRRELPCFQAWPINQNHNGVHPIHPLSGCTMEPPLENQGKQNEEFPVTSLAMLSGAPQSVVLGKAGLQDRPSYSQFISEAGFGQGAAMVDFAPMINRIQSELAASLTATTAAELPCTVKLRIWPHDLQNPCAPLDAERCLLIIPHAVLCSEMGAHFSPCGRYLAACVACVLPQMETDIGLSTQLSPDVTGAATSPTRHPIFAQKVIYELRIYSLEESTFGTVLVSRAVRAAHCLTSIQFSPTSEHILLAYGRRHSSLLKSIVINGETSFPIYSVLEVYKVSDMELVSVLPSAEDEVNVACFHPLAGGGLVYGTKEGKLRVFQYDGALMS